MRAKPGSGPAKYRRSTPLVLYWQDGALVFENYALRTRISAEPLVCSILDYCGEWRSFRQINSHLGDYEETSVRSVLRRLCAHGVLERSDQQCDPRVAAMESWAAWNPAAGFFHFSSKDTEFADDQLAAFGELKRRARHDPMPRPLKSYANAPHTRLPRDPITGEFPEILKNRRTWRKFGRAPVTLRTLAQTLKLTFGIQQWIDVPGLGKAAIKTSPSGGSLHPIEAYVLVRRVKGLKRGIYHYNAARHELDWLREGMTTRSLEKNLAGQWWFARSAFLVVMTAIFPRTQWKYDFPRTYRVVLAEAGHLCQTFCLTATWLGLAPFCTMALRDSKWEEWLGIDGVSESVLYLAGAGTRPSATEMQDANILTSGKGAVTIGDPSDRLRKCAFS